MDFSLPYGRPYPVIPASVIPVSRREYRNLTGGVTSRVCSAATRPPSNSFPPGIRGEFYRGRPAAGDLLRFINRLYVTFFLQRKKVIKESRTLIRHCQGTSFGRLPAFCTNSSVSVGCPHAARPSAQGNTQNRRPVGVLH